MTLCILVLSSHARCSVVNCWCFSTAVLEVFKETGCHAYSLGFFKTLFPALGCMGVIKGPINGNIKKVLFGLLILNFVFVTQVMCDL